MEKLPPLRRCQLDMIDAIEKNQQGVICSFVGTGKSRVKKEVISQTEGHRVLVFPSINLVEQFGAIYAQRAFTLSAERPKSPAEIADHFAKTEGVMLVTYQSLHKISQYFDRLSVVIYDEAHHICTPRHITMLEQLATLGVRRYFFTATPKDTKGLRMLVSAEQLGEQTEFQTVAFDRCKRLLGGLIYQYNFSLAVHEKVVSDYTLCFVTYQMTNESREATQFRNIMRLAKKNGRKRILVYNRYVLAGRNGKTTVQGFAAADPAVKFVTGQMKADHRAEVFAWFQAPGDDVRVLCNVGTIKEGVDLPCIDMLAFCDDKQSRIEIVQCLGRGLRTFAGKTDCMVCCCIPISADSVQSESEFQTIRHVLTALKSIDSRIEDVLNGKQSTLRVIYSKHKKNTLECNQFVNLVRVGVDSKLSYEQLATKYPQHFAPPQPKEKSTKIKKTKHEEQKEDPVAAQQAEIATSQKTAQESVVDYGKPLGAGDDKKKKCFLENINNVVNEFGAYGTVIDPLLKKWFDFICKQRANFNLPEDQSRMLDDVLSSFC